MESGCGELERTPNPFCRLSASSIACSCNLFFDHTLHSD